MAEQSERKKKPTKSKLSRPNPKQKQVPYSIEISASAVKIIRTDVKGNVINSGFAPIDGDPVWADKSWIDRLSQCVKDAARNAKVPKGSNFACSVVAGGPNVVMQRFTWPELTHQAMLENAKHEIASYLPGVASNFVVSAEVQKRNESEDGKVPTMDVFVAAMPKDMATAISTAITWAGFRVTSVDVNENVRARLVERCGRFDGGAPKSYGILDLSSSQQNITLYLDGFFYSTHYFTGANQTTHTGATIDEIESLMGSLDSSKSGESIVEHNVEALLGEISFVVDFIRYQERGSNLECILILGKTQPGFSERLSAGLDMHVYANDSWMRTSILDSVKGDYGFYLDAYASGLPSSVIGAQHMLDVKTEVMLKNPGRRLFLMASGMTIVLACALAVGLFIPFVIEQGARREYYSRDAREAQIDLLVENSPTQDQLDVLNGQIDFIETRVDGIDDFYEEFAGAAVMVPIIFQAGFSEVTQVNTVTDRIDITATATYFNHLADLIEYFRNHELIREANAVAGLVQETDTRDHDEGTANFIITAYQARRAGAQ
jgi:Tfp pilus assembly PilM family ATPase